MGQLPETLKQAGSQAYDELEPYVRETGRQLTRYGRENLPSERRAQNYEPFPLKDYGYQTPMPSPPQKWYKDAPPEERGMSTFSNAKPGPYLTQLQPSSEQSFQQWVKTNHIPWQESPTSDYDMRGFWQAQQSGDPNAKRASNLHFPDTYKTPYHKTFSNESKYATPSAPHWEGDRLVGK
jgi:hypothetical protein